MRSDPLAEHGVIHRPLAGDVLLTAWERGARRSWSELAMGLLSAGCPGLPPGAAWAMTIAARDRSLLELHRLSFGETMAAFAACQACGERLEFAIPCDWAAGVLDGARGETLSVDGWSVTLHLASGADLLRAAAEPDTDAARRALLGSCILANDPDGAAVPYHLLPEPIQARAEARLAGLHEATELSATLACPACQAPQTVLVDLPGYLWAETRNAARRLIAEVSELANAHGWSEAAILAMSGTRRRAYLEMIRA